MARSRRWMVLVCLATLSVVLVGVSLFVGSSSISVREVAAVFRGRGEARHEIIVLDVRLPRALLAWVVGAALAGSGVILQGLFRNPLADPFVVGVSGGAALGAVVAIVAGVQVGIWGLGAVTLAGFLGALGAAWLVWRIASRAGRTSMGTLLLAGFAVSAFASAVVSVLLLTHTKNWGEILSWLWGSVDRADGWMRVRVALPFVALSLGGVTIFSRDLNILLLGEEPAQQLGVDVERVRKVLLAASSIAAAAAVAVCGLIGFVGLIVPHVVRLLVGPDHRALVPVSIFAGGVFLVGADLLARLVWPPSGLPVGTVTALAGAPFFVLLLRQAR